MASLQDEINMATPQTVGNIQVANLLNKRKFLVSWNTNPELDITSYNIYRSENQFSGYVKVGSVGLPSTQFVDIVPFTFGVNFFWKVTAVNLASQESDILDTQAVSDITIGQFDEEPFKQVELQRTDLVFGEIPTGLVNSANVTYTTLFPFRVGTLQYIRNGLVQIQTGPNPDFTESTSQMGFTVAVPPVSITDTIMVNYIKYTV